jgi:hypothetical protein
MIGHTSTKGICQFQHNNSHCGASKLRATAPSAQLIVMQQPAANKCQKSHAECNQRSNLAFAGCLKKLC